MGDYYVDEDLLTGNNDGTDWANAYRSFPEMVTGVGTITEASTIFIRSLGVADVARNTLGITFTDQELTIIGDSDCKLYHSSAYATVLNLQGGSAGSDITVKNITILQATNTYGIKLTSSSPTSILNCKFIGRGGIGHRAVYGTSIGDASVENCTFVRVRYGIGNTTTGNITSINNYTSASDACYDATSSGLVTLITSGSSDLTGSVGLQSIAYDDTTFLDTTIGAEDLHLIETSPLVGVGTVTSNLTDYEGITYSIPRSLGAHNYGEATPSGIIVLRRRRIGL